MKRILVAIAVVVVLVLAVIAVWSVLSTSGSTEPRSVEGSWSYEVDDDSGSATGTGALTIVTGTSQGTWAGPFEGTSTSVFEGRTRSGGAAWGNLLAPVGVQAGVDPFEVVGVGVEIFPDPFPGLLVLRVFRVLQGLQQIVVPP